jgi:hypothetical protein
MIEKLNIKFKDSTPKSSETLNAHGQTKVVEKIDEIIDALNLLLIERIVNKKSIIIKKKQDYINGLNMATNEYISNISDKKAVKKALGRINIKGRKRD